MLNDVFSSNSCEMVCSREWVTHRICYLFDCSVALLQGCVGSLLLVREQNYCLHALHTMLTVLLKLPYFICSSLHGGIKNAAIWCDVNKRVRVRKRIKIDGVCRGDDPVIECNRGLRFVELILVGSSK
jgi:hypothetical protein